MHMIWAKKKKAWTCNCNLWWRLLSSYKFSHHHHDHFPLNVPLQPTLNPGSWQWRCYSHCRLTGGNQTNDVVVALSLSLYVWPQCQSRWDSWHLLKSFSLLARKIRQADLSQEEGDGKAQLRLHCKEEPDPFGITHLPPGQQHCRESGGEAALHWESWGLPDGGWGGGGGDELRGEQEVIVECHWEEVHQLWGSQEGCGAMQQTWTSLLQLPCFSKGKSLQQRLSNHQWLQRWQPLRKKLPPAQCIPGLELQVREVANLPISRLVICVIFCGVTVNYSHRAKITIYHFYLSYYFLFFMFFNYLILLIS